MDWYFDQSIKYWKNLSIISGVIGFIYLAQVIMSSAALELFKSFTPTGYPSFLSLIGVSVVSIILFILFLMAGILSSRGNTAGVIMSLILSIIILLISFSFPMLIGRAEVLDFLYGFLILLSISPQTLLSLFNVYYSIRALRSKIEGAAVSLYRFFSCSLQYSVAVFLITPMIIIFWNIFAILQLDYNYFPEIFAKTAFFLIIGIILLSSSLTAYSGHVIFNNDEETLSRKRVYLLSTATIIILLIASVTIPIVGPLLGLFAAPFIVASLGFVAAMPRKEPIVEAADWMQSQIPHEIQTTVEVRREYVPKPEPLPSKVKVVGVKYCRYCGRIIPADSIYCEHCGRRLR